TNYIELFQIKKGDEMEVLRKVYKDDEPIYHVKTDKGSVIRIKGSDDLTDSETEELLMLVSQDIDKMKKQ
ncbi:MAG: C1q-binding complement inhibitor VraX, partial [Staphylococcus equorum]|nr:C1q-binding complement inhibitor VraX [Staphylococcus equorum]